MKKRLAAALLSAAIFLAAVPATGAAFTDISDGETAIAAATLQGMGIVAGTTDTTFDPDGSLTRAQACTMLISAMGLSSQVNTYSRKTIFSDVLPSAWYNGRVNLAYTQGIINGYGNGTFGPNDPVTYGQFATMLLRMLGYTTEQIGSVWPLDYTAFCEDLGLSEGLTLSPNKALDRGEAAVLLYHAVKEKTAGSGQEYYKTISGVSSTQEAILLDTSASYGGGSGLVMVYALGAGGGVTYYTQVNRQSDALTGSVGALLFDGAGRVTGFVPESDGYLDVKIGSATASTLTSAGGASYRISSGASVIANGEVYSYSTSGYLQLNSKAGKTVRLYYDDNGAISYLYLAGGTASSSEAAVADTAAAESALARDLGISGKAYAITKNGVEANASALAQYDVGYYDGASNTLRVSDYRVSGVISAASPNVTAATSITVSGHTFEVLECAWDTLDDFSIGKKVTLLLTDDCKVAAAYSASKLSADMVGVLSKDGKSVTLVGSGITLSSSAMEYEESALGSLVSVTAGSSGSLTCKLVSGSGQKLDLEARTLGSLELAPACSIYEWAGGGFVYDLEGDLGAASSDFQAIQWTDTLSSSCVSYYHTNSAGQVDAVLLKNVTGNCYTYGKLRVYEGSEGIDLGTASMSSYNRAASVINSSGTTTKYLFPHSASGSYVGIALGQSDHGYGRVAAVQSLTKLSGVSAGDFFLKSGSWYVRANGTEYPVSDQVEIHLTASDLWLGGEVGLTSILADRYSLTLYYDAGVPSGGAIRVIAAANGEG